MHITTQQKSRFLARIQIVSECWLWAGPKMNTGYGTMCIGSRSLNTKTNALAHRISYFLHNGTIPLGSVIMHTCDNPACVNPEHLRAGTQKENIRDCIQKGRARYSCHVGANNPNAKITEQQAKAIKGSAMRLIDIAREYGISISHASRLRSGLGWNQ